MCLYTICRSINVIICFFFYFIGGDGTYHLKVLVPGVAAGAIIGKGGDTIAQLQKDTGARVKMSKSHDFYPGRLKIFPYAVFVSTRWYDSLCIQFYAMYRNNRKSVFNYG